MDGVGVVLAIALLATVLWRAVAWSLGTDPSRDMGPRDRLSDPFEHWKSGAVAPERNH